MDRIRMYAESAYYGVEEQVSHGVFGCVCLSVYSVLDQAGKISKHIM